MPKVGGAIALPTLAPLYNISDVTTDIVTESADIVEDIEIIDAFLNI